jgi:hypothetical protein
MFRYMWKDLADAVVASISCYPVKGANVVSIQFLGLRESLGSVKAHHLTSTWSFV